MKHAGVASYVVVDRRVVFLRLGEAGCNHLFLAFQSVKSATSSWRCARSAWIMARIRARSLHIRIARLSRRIGPPLPGMRLCTKVRGHLILMDPAGLSAVQADKGDLPWTALFLMTCSGLEWLR